MLSAAVAMDKLICKRLLDFHGFPQVAFCQAGEPGWREQAAAMGMPLWVKPSRLGSSVGITKVASAERELDEAVELAARHDPRVIVEAHAEGREVECSVIGNTEPETSLPGEIVTQGAEWYDYEAKYSEGGMELAVPAPIGDEAIARVRELAAEVYRAIDCRGLARCDFFVLDSGEVLVNEINTIPGFTATSVFGKLFEASGVSYPELCDRLVQPRGRAPPRGARARVLGRRASTSPIVREEPGVLAAFSVKLGDPDQVVLRLVVGQLDRSSPPRSGERRPAARPSPRGRSAGPRWRRRSRRSSPGSRS